MINRDSLRQQFDAAYLGLNQQQKRAVDQIEGPVMVIAGPGTGKTQILSVRIGKILLDTDATVKNILCLTYTDAGVLAMRKRLLSMIGPDAYNVPIHSFHSFCNMVIQENRHLFHKRDLQPISELEQMQCLVELIDGFDNDNPLKRYKSDAYFEANFLKELFSSMKREGWSPEFLLKKVDEYVTDIIPEQFANKTKAKKGIYELTIKGKEEIDRMEKLKAAVNAFEQYQSILRARQRYDFDDMINWVIKAFEENADLLARYQEQFLYFLVDEYQDTSGSQNRLVELLVSFWDAPNLFVVGDDDQSIYRFQGANLENMQQLAKRYEKDLLKVVLTDNYRSVQPILDAAHVLIGNNKQRLVNDDKTLEKLLTAARQKEMHEPLFRYVANEMEENIMVTEEIRKLMAEGVDPARIAVIYKEHKNGEELRKFLQLQKIPYYARKSINLLKNVFIRQILCYIKWVIAEEDIPFSGDACLFEILHHRFHGLSPVKIAAICHEVNANGRTKKKPDTIREWLAQLAAARSQKLFSEDEGTDQLVRMHKLLEELATEANNRPLLKWLELLFNEAGILSYIMRQPDKAWLMQLLNGFFDYVQEECRRDPDLTLKGLARQIELLEENGISIPLVQTSGNDKGVNLLTCHGSKGLEYEYVFLIGACSSLWEGKKKINAGYKIPSNVFTSESAEEREEELRRLFFVAATRAEKYLYVSYPQYTNDGKALEPSRFMLELAGIKMPEPYIITEDVKVQYSVLRYGMVEQPELEKAERSFLEQMLSHFTMNVTALNNYLDCPVRFYYNSLVRIPSAPSESAQFGTSIHSALAFFYNKMMEEDRTYPDKEVLLNRFEYDITSNREVYTEEGLQRYLDHGRTCLSAFYDHFFKESKGEFIRTEIPMQTTVDEVPIKGFIDMMQYWGNEVAITDFKTGSLVKSRTRYEFAEPGHEKKPEGGNYWRQAVFYKILFDRLMGKSKSLRSIDFLYVEPNNKGEFDRQIVHIRPEHESFVKEQIRDTWTKIQNHEFYKGCGKPDCHWCNFVKDHKIYIDLHEVEEEKDPSSVLRVVD